MATNKKNIRYKKSNYFFDVEKGIKGKIIIYQHNIQLLSNKSKINIIKKNAKNYIRFEIDNNYFDI